MSNLQANSDQQPIEYGFGGRLAAGFPSQILMDITEVCNLACTHCPHPTFMKSEHYGGRHLESALNEKMIEEVRQHGRGLTQYIRYASNGEPLVHPHAYEMIQAAVDHSGVFVTLTTNGKIMNERRTQRLLESGIHLIDISIDAFRPETYAKIRVKGNLEITRGNVLRLLRWVQESKAKTKVVVSFVEQAENTAEARDFEAFWRDQGVDDVVIRRLHSCSGAVEGLADQQREALRSSKRRPCLYPWERIVINARGDLAFCPSDWIHGSYVADYRNTTILKEWQGDFYRGLRQAHLRNNYLKHSFCGQCPDWSNTRWPHEGRSYADMVDDFVHGEGEVDA
ncbi:radical SAM protein [Methyloversatilis sp. XJ19-13]|uniref:radical SAM/SPASM domain-containing protein n=1 Tax=Methyloversatilis sp. XJ19-13 TaxID=2963430 RepID=UPI00211C19D5|nr:radical SAM protein [Methyloversatilis sp. XJ19-13]MCQ9373890.1 radical SAM protein [Methyloversatilis sp. XJ19-13]